MAGLPFILVTYVKEDKIIVSTSQYDTPKRYTITINAKDMLDECASSDNPPLEEILQKHNTMNEEEETEESETDKYEAISLDRVAELAPELMAEDFLELLHRVRYHMYGLNFYVYWRFWDRIGVDELTVMVSEAASIRGALYLLDEIYISKWPKFHELLSRLSPIILAAVVPSSTENRSAPTTNTPRLCRLPVAMSPQVQEIALALFHSFKFEPGIRFSERLRQDGLMFT